MRSSRVLKAAAQNAGVRRIVSFGECAQADARRLIRSRMQAEPRRFRHHSWHDVTYKLARRAAMWCTTRLGVLAAAQLLGADLALARSRLPPQAAGRAGERMTLDAPAARCC